MAVNKVIFDGRVLIDVSKTTVTSDKLINGTTALDATGTLITGTFKITSWGDLLDNNYNWSDLAEGGE